MKKRMMTFVVAMAALAAVALGSGVASAQTSTPYATPGGPYTSVIGAPLILTATATTEIASYQWDFGDGSFAIGREVAKTYFTPGIYTVTLTVTTSNGLTSTATTTARIYAYRTAVVAYPCAVTTSANLPTDGSGGPSIVSVTVTRCVFGVPIDDIPLPLQPIRPIGVGTTP